MAIEVYLAPDSLEEASEILRGSEVTILAGGTDLMPQMRAGQRRLAPVLMSIRRVPGLDGITLEDDRVSIGARVTLTQLLDSPLVRDRLNLLWQACDRFASDQIRNAATVGGNLCNASPAGDTLPPLLALDARAVLTSKPDGALETRRVALEEFFLGPGRTGRLPAELLTAVEVPLPPAGFAGEFYKHGTRPALDISTISIAVGARREGKTLRHVRIALGAAAPTPIRVRPAEALLEGEVPDAARLEAAAQAVLEAARPISDVRASDWYRRELIHNVMRRTLSHVCQL